MYLIMSNVLNIYDNNFSYKYSHVKSFSSPIVVFDVCNFENKSKNIQLQDIPKKIANPLNKENDLQ